MRAPPFGLQVGDFGLVDLEVNLVLLDAGGAVNMCKMREEVVLPYSSCTRWADGAEHWYVGAPRASLDGRGER